MLGRATLMTVASRAATPLPSTAATSTHFPAGSSRLTVSATGSSMSGRVEERPAVAGAAAAEAADGLHRGPEEAVASVGEAAVLAARRRERAGGSDVGRHPL